MECVELSEKLKSDGNDILIVDVRSPEEYVDGHIPNAVLVPSEQWQDPQTVDSILKSFPTKSKIVVHCMKSQVRGPSCARKLRESLPQNRELDTDENQNSAALQESLQPEMY